jgi:hypothetical protein
MAGGVSVAVLALAIQYDGATFTEFRTIPGRGLGRADR